MRGRWQGRTGRGATGGIRRGVGPPRAPAPKSWLALLLLGLVQPVQAQVEAPTEAQIQAEPGLRRFTVYFAHETAQITTEAEAVLKQASSYQRSSSGDVTVTAHADRLGSRSYNMRLSRQRARQVGGRLVGLGVPARAITLRWTGETTLPHPTVDEMYEPLNRCAVIEITSAGP